MRSLSTRPEATRLRAVAAAARLRRIRLGRCRACHAAVRGDDDLALIRRRIGHAECAPIVRDRRPRSGLRVPRIGLPPLAGG